MLLSSILIVFCFMFSLLNIRTPVRALKMPKKNSKSGLYDTKDLDLFDIVLYNFGLRKHWKRFLGITEEDGQTKIHSPWYLKNITKMSYGSDGPVFKPDWKGIACIAIPIILNLCLVAFVPVTAFGIPLFGIMGATIQSNGGGGGNYSVGASWNGGAVPGPLDDFDVVAGDSIVVTGTVGNAGGVVQNTSTLRFDGQVNTVPTIMNMINGATLANSGTVDQTGTGSTGYAGINGVSTELFTGTAPTLGNGYWKVGQIDFQMDITTGGSTCTFEFVDDCTIDAITVTANDTLKCVTNNTTITGLSTGRINIFGTLEITGTSGNEITITGSDYMTWGAGCTINVEYMIFEGGDGNNGVGCGIQDGASTFTQIDNCTFTSTGGGAYGNLWSQQATVIPIITNCTINNLNTGASYFNQDVVVDTGAFMILDTCTLTNGTVGMKDTNGWIVDDDGSGNFTIYGILASSETPSAGYRAVDITGDLTLSQADAYGTSFNTSYTLGANAPNVDDVTTDASTTLAFASFTLTTSGTYTNTGTTTFTTGTLNTTGTFTISAGSTFGSNTAYTLDCAGAMTIVTTGTFNSPTGAGAMTVAGDLTGTTTMTWNQNGVTTVLDGVTQTLSGFSSFAANKTLGNTDIRTSTTLTITGVNRIGLGGLVVTTFNMAGTIADGGSGTLVIFSINANPVVATSMPSSFGGIYISIAVGADINIPASTWTNVNTFEFDAVNATRIVTLTGNVTLIGSGAFSMKTEGAYQINVVMFTNTLDCSGLTGTFTCGNSNHGGSITATTGTIKIGGTLTNTADSNFTFGSNSNYVLDVNGSLNWTTGTLNLPNATGTGTFSGATWTEGGTVNGNSGLITFDKSGTTTLGSNATNFYSITVDASTTLNTSATDYSLTASALTSITGTLTGNASVITFHSLVVNSGGEYSATSGTTTINNETIDKPIDVKVGGTFTHNSGTLAITDQSQCTISFAGTGNPYNLILGPLGASRNYRFDVDTLISNDLTINSGPVFQPLTTHNLTITNDMTINTGGALTGTSGNITVGNDISNAGTFTAGTSTFVLTDADHTLTGSWTFWDFTCSVATARTLTFDNTATYTFGGNVTLNGASGQLLTIQSDAGGSQFDFVMSSGAVKTNISYLSVVDSDASGSHISQKPINPTSSINGGNTKEWFAVSSGMPHSEMILLIIEESN